MVLFSRCILVEHAVYTFRFQMHRSTSKPVDDCREPTLMRELIAKDSRITPRYTTKIPGIMAGKR